MYYIRYADDWLIGIWGSRKDSLDTLEIIEKMLKEKLKLELSKEKTKITHAGKDKAKFLNFLISSPTPKEAFFEKGKVKKRASHVSITLEAPYETLKKKLIEEGFFSQGKDGRWKIHAIKHWMNYKHAEIIYRYNWIIRGLLNYYQSVDNLHIFHKLINLVLRHSCVLTLSRKLKLRSRKKVFKKFGKNCKDPVTGIELAIPEGYKKKKSYKSISEKDPFKIVKWSVRTQHLLEGPCVGCGSTEDIQIHHVRKLADLDPSKDSFSRIMSTLQRKQVPVCKKCHIEIHTGNYDRKSFRNIKR